MKKLKIKYVDAARFRNTIDTDFSGVATYLDFAYIPKGEMWIDKYLKLETENLLALFLLEYSMRNEPFRLIRARAAKELTDPTVAVRTERTEKMGRFTIRYVDGATVRKAIDPFFLLGGHGLVYDYIPKSEIWIDTKSDPKEWKYTLAHELTEFKLMKKGDSYYSAHDYALAYERAERRKDGVADFVRG